VYLLASLFVWLYAAYRDIESRHVPNLLWIVLLLLALLRALSGQVHLLAYVVSVSVVLPFAIGLYYYYDVGGADAKALFVASVLYPEQIAVFLIGTGVGLLPFYNWDELPAIVAFTVGAICATVVYLL